jgi:hypothetical protein
MKIAWVLVAVLAAGCASRPTPAPVEDRAARAPAPKPAVAQPAPAAQPAARSDDF